MLILTERMGMRPNFAGCFSIAIGIEISIVFDPDSTLTNNLVI